MPTILWPTFALVALVFVVWTTMAVQRTGHARRHPPTSADLADREATGRYFRPVEMPANNLANLFEMPVLFFALVPLLIVTRQAGTIEVALAWAYVLLRMVHSYIHIVPRNVNARGGVYALSCLVLFAMWAVFALATARGG